MKQRLVLEPGVWLEVTEVWLRFLSRARARDFSEDEEPGYICPACQDRKPPPLLPFQHIEPLICDTELTPDNGRVLSCSHEICVDCLLQLRGAPITHDGQL
jgi:hypothetical protein